MNFSAALPNARFSDGVDSDGHPVGWTVNDERLVLGTDIVTRTQGRAMSPRTGGAPRYTINGPGYSFTSDRAYGPGGAQPGWAWEGVQRDLDPGSTQMPFRAEVVDGALRLYSQDNWCLNVTASQYCSVFGPDAWSSPFTAKAGDDLAFDWSAALGKDDYEVYGFLVDQDGNHTELMYGRGFSQPWTTSAGVIPADGTYRFRFVSGTYDATGGRQVGASLYIDDVRVLSSDATAAVAQAVGRLVHYEHTGQNPPAELTIGVSAETGDGASAPAQVPAAVELVDDAPVISPVAGATYTNTPAADVFVNDVGSITATDPEGDPITYSIAGGTANAVEIGGRHYTHSLTGERGTFHLAASDGSYVFVPDAAAMDSVAFDTTEEFTVVATANGKSATATFPVTVDVQRSAPGAPTDLTVVRGDLSAVVSWTAPGWTGGAEITDHVIEISTDDGATWRTAVPSTGSSATTHELTGLELGADLRVRVIAVNSEGAGSPSAPLATTVIAVPDAPTITRVVPGNRTLTVEVAPPAEDGGAAVTNYEWSVDGGVTWTAGAPASTSTTLALRPLDNGTVYPVQVRAVNEAGAGSASAQLAAGPVAAPVLPPTPGTPPAPTGGAVQIVDGVETPITRSTPSPRPGDMGAPIPSLRYSDGTFAVSLLGVDETGERLELDAQGRLILVAGAYADVSGEGFRPGTVADVWLLSTPVLLGTVPVGADGTFSARLPIPEGIQPGPHTIQLNGIAHDGTVRTLSVGVIVRAAELAGVGDVTDGASGRPASALAFTGTHAMFLSLLGAGLLVAGVSVTGVRRRR